MLYPPALSPTRRSPEKLSRPQGTVVPGTRVGLFSIRSILFYGYYVLEVFITLPLDKRILSGLEPRLFGETPSPPTLLSLLQLFLLHLP